MKKTLVLGLATAVTAITSFAALADSQYPAADFEPKVIYTAPQATAPAPAAVAHEVDAKYPAANFQPTVIYSADSATVAKAPAPVVVEEVDPKYPAANFQPKVIYP